MPPPGHWLGFPCSPMPAPTPRLGGARERSSGPTERIKARLLSTWDQAVLGWVCVCVLGGSLCPRPPGEGEPRAGFRRVPFQLSGAGGGGGGGRDSMPRSLMTQAWAGGQTDIFSKEKLLWGPPSGTSLAPPALRGGLGTEPWGAGLCARELGHNVQPGYTTLDTSLHGQTGSPMARGGAAHAQRTLGLRYAADTHPRPHPRRPGTRDASSPPSRLPAPPGGHSAAVASNPVRGYGCSSLRGHNPGSVTFPMLCAVPLGDSLPAWRLPSLLSFPRPWIPMDGCQRPRASELPSLSVNS